MPILTSLQLGILVLGLAVAILAVLRLWQISVTEDRQQRLGQLVGAAGGRQSAPIERVGWLDRLGAMLAATPVFGARARTKHITALTRAGFRRQGSLAVLLAVKLAFAIVCAALMRPVVDWTGFLPDQRLAQLAIVLVTGFGGWLLPDIALDRVAAWRRQRIEQALPDALDLLVICAEAGLSLSQAIEEIAHDLRNLSPEISEEFAATAGEMEVLADRGAALENLARRTGIDSLRGLISTLTQSLKFGTPLAESVRLFAAEMRMGRMAKLEESAARLPVLLTLPMVGFIIPSLLLVIVGPVVLHIIDNVLNVFPNLMH